MKVSKKLVLLGLFAVLAAAFAVTRSSDVAEAQAPAATKSCTVTIAPTATVAGRATCTLTITANFPTGSTVTITAPGGAGYLSATVSGGTPAVTANLIGGPPAVSFTLDCGPAGTTCGASSGSPVVVVEVINLPAATVLPAAASQDFTNAVSGVTTTPFAVGALLVPTPAPATATKTCTATGPSTASCTLTLNFTSPPIVGISTVTVTLTGGTLTITGASLTPSTCGIASVSGNVVTMNVTAPTCTALSISETVSGLPIGATTTISQTATFGGLSSGTVTASTTVTTTALGLSVTCTSTPGAPPLTAFTALVNAFVPAAPTTPLAAVGVVPATVFCNVNLRDLDPGVVEISSVNGLLVSSSGTLTTNLRIPCGTLTPFTPGSCTGTISFSVASGGVGLVQILARYEPAPLSTTTERETSAIIAFVAPSVLLTLSLNPNPVAVGQTGTAQVTFLVQVTCATGTAAVGVGPACVDVATGTIITAVPSSSVLSGTVVFSIDNAAIARWTGQPVAGDVVTTPPPAGAPPSVTGFTASPNQVAVRCGFFPTTPLPSTTTIGAFFPFPSLASFFGGCTSVRAQYLGVAPGAATVNAQFIPDLPGAFANVQGTGVAPQLQALFGFVGATNITQTRTLEVVGVTPTGGVDLARGCNNVSPTVTEAAADYAKRVSPAGALVAIWEHQAATNTFRGWSPAAGAPSDLAQVTRLRPIFICVSGPARLDQPAA